MGEIKHVEIVSKYNDEETAKLDEFQMLMAVDFYLDDINIRMVKRTTTIYGYGTNLAETSRSEETYVFKMDSVMTLVFEDLDNCYHYLHALAVGYNGDHLNFMEINLKTVE